MRKRRFASLLIAIAVSATTCFSTGGTVNATEMLVTGTVKEILQ